MAFFRTRIIKGKPYVYREERWREGDKVRSRSTIVKAVTAPTSAETRKASIERYRDLLRQNVFIYGRSHPGQRYWDEAQARDAYQRELAAEQRGEVFVEVTPKEHWQNMVEELGSKATGSMTPQAAHTPKGSPTDDEEARHSDFGGPRDDFLSEQYAEHAESASEDDNVDGGDRAS